MKQFKPIDRITLSYLCKIGDLDRVKRFNDGGNYRSSDYILPFMIACYHKHHNVAYYLFNLDQTIIPRIDQIIVKYRNFDIDKTRDNMKKSKWYDQNRLYLSDFFC